MFINENERWKEPVTNAMDWSEEEWHEVWMYLHNEVMIPLWNAKFKSMFESIRMHEADYESLCGEELFRALKSFKKEESSLKTFATNVITRKAYTFLKANSKTDKRKAFSSAESLDVPVSEDGDETLLDLLESDFSIWNEIPTKNVKAVGCYIKELTAIQKAICICLLLNYNDEDITSALGITRAILKAQKENMAMPEKIQVLRSAMYDE